MKTILLIDDERLGPQSKMTVLGQVPDGVDQVAIQNAISAAADGYVPAPVRERRIGRPGRRVVVYLQGPEAPGQSFASMSAAAAALGVTTSAIGQALRRSKGGDVFVGDFKVCFEPAPGQVLEMLAANEAASAARFA